MNRTTARVSRVLVALGWAIAWGVGLHASGCALDERPLDVATPDASTSSPPSDGPACVGESCAGLSLMPCGQECTEVACPADDVCRDYPARIPQGSCRPGGSCASVADCRPAWKPAARDGAACDCDGASCKLVAGEACTRPDDCAGGICVATDSGDNVCCAAACGAGEVCAPDGSTCLPAAPCSEDARRCSGTLYQHCTGGVWEMVTDCGTLGCSNERGGCLRSAGQACELGADCGQGSCLPAADGNLICCTAGCDTDCRRCAASGTACEDIEDDEACGSIACPVDACRSYDPVSVTTSRCRAGRCATPEEACTSFAPQRADLECSPTALCDAEGNCSQPKKALLEACSTGPECSSGACVASSAGGSVCCGAACAGNEICNASGACVLAPVCESGRTQCSGSSFQRCNGGQWTTVLECGAIGCSEARGGCFGGPGDTCASDVDCGAGSCQPTSGGGSVCCTAACDGACRRCASSGVACESLADDDACGSIGCPPDTTCRDFPPSVGAQRCVAGRCGSSAQLCVGAPRAAGEVCSANNLCDNAGNCSAPKRGLGESCGSGNECALGNCVEGVCCNAPCDGVCSTCAISGICRAPSTDSRCSTGRCESPGVCEAPSVSCGTQACPIEGAVCCSELSAGGDTRLFCESGSESCPAQPAFIPDIPINCDQHVDCPTNRVCCMAGTSTSTEVSCKLPQPSPGTDETSIDFESCAPLNPMLFGNQLCQSPQGTFPCPAFETCDSTNDRLPGFAFCR